ncbi:D-lactate dehydrogenase [Byssothecium circinans]|uniref:D-lactate dehydrogenase n=1 Tax=Byssothecium circinans TaxID=147558 RepID=A0A6A5TWC5_9PLEO|nr:D-lactate dehydrogenase [Byssothecium circinans]
MSSIPQQSTLPLSSAPQLSYHHSDANIQGLINDIQTRGEDIKWTSEPTTCTSRSSTRHSPASGDQVPKAVFWPKNTGQVAEILRACWERRIAVSSYSGGTSLGGALTASRAGICIDFSSMNEIGEVWEDDAMVSVQPGVGWMELNEKLERDGTGLFWPVDPAPGAKVGGMIAMSCSGTNAYRYGTVKNWIISLTLVLADGTIVKTRNRPKKSSAGYDLNALITGSEGTLALITTAILKLAPLPTNLHVGLSTFPSLQHGLSTALALLKTSALSLEAIELADQNALTAIQTSSLAPGRQWSQTPTLFLKFSGASQEAVSSQIALTSAVCEANSGTPLEASSSQAFIATVWGGRKCLGNALVGMKRAPSDLFLTTDAAVPSSQVARLAEESARIVREECAGEEEGWFCASVAHVGDGNVHTAIVCGEGEGARAEKVVRGIQRVALALEGTATGEHGVGLKLRDLLEEEVGKEGVDLMRNIKFALDPRGILNPDKVVRLKEGF